MNQKKWTAKTTKNETPIVVTANSKKEAVEKIQEHRPETKAADVIRHN